MKCKSWMSYGGNRASKQNSLSMIGKVALLAATALFSRATQAQENTDDGKHPHKEEFTDFVRPDLIPRDEVVRNGKRVQMQSVQINSLGAATPISRPFVTILLKYPDVSTVPHEKSWYEGLMDDTYPGMGHYFKEVSNGAMNIDGSIVVGWYTLPNPKSYYTDGTNFNWQRATDDATLVADADVYFPSFWGINMIFNDGTGCCAWGGGTSATRDGVTKGYGATWMGSLYWMTWPNQAVTAHEMGHAMGLPHSDGLSGPRNIKGNGWDPMDSADWTPDDPTYGWLNVHYNSYHKNKLGWIPPTRKYMVPAGSEQTIDIERTAMPTENGNYLMAQIPINGSSTHFYTIEARKQVGGYEFGTPGDAIVIYEVDTNSSYVSRVVGPEGVGLPTVADSMWLPGEVFQSTNYGVRVAINSASETSFNVTIKQGPLPPVVKDDAVTISEDFARSINVLANDLPTGALTIVSVTPGTQGGKTSIGTSGTTQTAIYRPPLNFHGIDTFTYTVRSSNDQTATATVTVTVRPINDPPVAENQNVVTDEDALKVITLSATDVDSTQLNYSIYRQPTQGTLSNQGAAYTYTPKTNFFGTDSFIFIASDGESSGLATVNITINPINDAPVAQGQNVSTTEDAPKSITLNSTDIDSTTLTYTIATPPEHGTLTGSGNAYEYSPAADSNAIDSFRFEVSDGELSNIATVTINVEAVNDAPIAEGQTVTTDEDTTRSITLQATDIDSTQLSYTVTSPPAHGTLSGSGNTLSYTPDADYGGTDLFTFSVSDGALSSEGAVNIGVTPINDAPTATAQNVVTDEDTAKSITLGGTDIDSATLTYSVVSGPSKGTLSESGNSYTYTPSANVNGSDSFTFRVSDGELSSTAIVNITINPVNDSPIAVNDTATTAKNTTVNINVLANDKDIDGEALSIASATQSPKGSVSVLNGTSIRFVPTRGFTGTTSFSYTIRDASGATATATVAVNVTR